MDLFPTDILEHIFSFLLVDLDLFIKLRTVSAEFIENVYPVIENVLVNHEKYRSFISTNKLNYLCINGERGAQLRILTCWLGAPNIKNIFIRFEKMSEYEAQQYIFIMEIPKLQRIFFEHTNGTNIDAMILSYLKRTVVNRWQRKYSAAISPAWRNNSLCLTLSTVCAIEANEHYDLGVKIIWKSINQRDMSYSRKVCA